MDPQQRSPNRFLANLTEDNFRLIGSQLRTVEFAQEAEIAVAGDLLLQAYFPHDGILSLVARMVTGETTEIAMVGRDSLFGASAALGSPKALITVITQLPGECSTLPIAVLEAAANQSKSFRATLERHEQAIFVQARQSAGCMASHPTVARLARWLLRARDAAGTDQLDFTQDFLAQMIGVKRNAVSLTATALQDKGLIRYSRGHILITDLEGLKSESCECYGTVREELEELKRRPLGRAG